MNYILETSAQILHLTGARRQDITATKHIDDKIVLA